MLRTYFGKWIVGLVILALVALITTPAPAQATTVTASAVSLPLLVNFQTATTVTPATYLPDDGQAYDATRGYGWTNTSGVPTSLVGNGRERNVASDKRLDTLMQMQLISTTTGVHTEGRWKAAVPNGSYQVTVAAGDPSYTNSHNVINVEGQPAIDFTPTANVLNVTNTVNATVTDGFINVDATGGTNTKIDYIEIRAVSSTTPTVTAVTPTNAATNVSTGTAVTVQLSNGVDPDTISSTSFQLIDPGGNRINGFYNSDAAYSNATFAPSTNLAPSTHYTVHTTSDLKDRSGNAYLPFTSTFTTGTSGPTQSTATFDKSAFTTHDAPTALALEPGGAALWAGYGNGDIVRYPLDANGHATGTPTTVSIFTNNRTISGLRFDPTATASNLKLWVSNGQFACDLAALGVACDDFTGAVSVLTGSSAATLTKRDVVTGLPRSVGNHMNNGVDFGPDGKLYLAQAANNGYGAPDSIWGNRSEDPLTSAILSIDVAHISGTLNVNTSMGYNPNASGALVKTYATGVRNAFNVLWASNGQMYVGVNESANGNTPAGPANNPPALTNLPAYNDYFTHIVAGKYYGHPNPTRSQFTLNGANPTSAADPFQVNEYPVGTLPNSNWQQPDLNLGLHRSPDGLTQFKSAVFGGTLQGQILFTEYSQGKDIVAAQLDSTGKAISTSQVATGFDNPLPIVSDPTSGRMYVGEYGRDPDGVGGKITLLTPHVTSTPPPTASSLNVASPEDVLGLGSRMVFSTVRSESRTGHAITLRNNGTSPLQISGMTFAGSKPADFQFASGTTTAFTLAPGTSRAITVNYRPMISGSAITSTYTSQATLTIHSNDATVPNYVVALSGLDAKNVEGTNEPSLQAIFNALGYTTNAGVTNYPKLNSVTPSSAATGDEVISAYWKKLDTNKPVTLFPVAHYSSKSAVTSAGIGWFNKGSSPSYLYAFPGGADGTNDGYGQNQLLLPKTTTGNFTFSPAGSFGVADSNGNRSADSLFTGKWHNLRFYPAKNASGATIPGAWLVGDDIGSPINTPSKNWDTQDFVFLLLNAQPDGGHDQPAPGTLATTLEFTGSAGGIANTGFSSTQGTLDASKLSLSGGQLHVMSSDGTNTSRTNALQLLMNAGTLWRIQSRFVGPFTAINAGSDQQSVFWGTDATHYLKAELEWNPTLHQRMISIWQQNGSNGSVLDTVALPGGNANTLDLRMDGDPTINSGQVTVLYSVNGGSFQTLGTVINLSNLFTANTAAGVWASHQGGGSPFTATFENFVVSRR